MPQSLFDRLSPYGERHFQTWPDMRAHYAGLEVAAARRAFAERVQIRLLEHLGANLDIADYRCSWLEQRCQKLESDLRDAQLMRGALETIRLPSGQTVGADAIPNVIATLKRERDAFKGAYLETLESLRWVSVDLQALHASYADDLYGGKVGPLENGAHRKAAQAFRSHLHSEDMARNRPDRVIRAYLKLRRVGGRLLRVLHLRA